MKKIIAFSIAAGTLLFGSNQAQAANLTKISFDNFNQENQKVTVAIEDPSSPTSAQDTSNFNDEILGGFRTIFAEAVNPTRDGDVVSKVSKISFGASDGLFSISSPSGIQGLTRITYDGDSSGLTSIDLLGTNEKTNALAIDILSIDLTGELTFTVVGSNGETATLSQGNLRAGEAIFNYEDFTISNGTSEAIFSDVASLSFEVSGPAEFDASFDNLRAVKTGVPEPTSVLSLIGLIGLAASAGIKKKS